MPTEMMLHVAMEEQLGKGWNVAEHRVNVVGNSTEAWLEAARLLETARKRGLSCGVTVKPVFVSPDGATKHVRRLHGVFVITGETS